MRVYDMFARSHAQWHDRYQFLQVIHTISAVFKLRVRILCTLKPHETTVTRRSERKERNPLRPIKEKESERIGGTGG